jgi:hypothetical protein
MNCVDWQERIALHAGGDAAPGEAEEVERHLGECPGCQVFWSGMKDSLAVLREVHAELPDAAHFTAVRTRVIAELERSRHPWRRLAWISGVATALMLLAVFWPRTTAVVDPPRVAAVIPQAALAGSGGQTNRLPRQRVAGVRQEKRAPVTVQLQTSDPNIIIYWIAD